jgi:hypothetical protein
MKENLNLTKEGLNLMRKGEEEMEETHILVTLAKLRNGRKKKKMFKGRRKAKTKLSR